ncbi:MAG: DUF922 domain-containing protein [Hellea sp.]
MSDFKPLRHFGKVKMAISGYKERYYKAHSIFKYGADALMKNPLHSAEPATRASLCVSKQPAATFKARLKQFKYSCMVGLCASLISACHKQDPYEPQNASAPVMEVVKTRGCDSATLLSKSPHYVDFQPVSVDAAALVPKFNEHHDVEGQEITKFQRKDGFTLYESSPRIIPEIYVGPWKTARREMSILGKKKGYFANAGHAPKYYFELGAFVKNTNEMYSIEPSKFTFFLSHKFTMPEWHAVGDVEEWQRALWDKLYCETAVHERTHTEITREHILGTVEEMLNLEGRTRDEVKESVRQTWHYRRAELMALQNAFDEEEKRKRRRRVLNK